MIAFRRPPRPRYVPPVPCRALTEKQHAVALLCGEALTYAEIAATLGISARTVKGHVHRIAELLPGSTEPYLRVVRYGMTLLVAEWQARTLDEADAEPAAHG